MSTVAEVKSATERLSTQERWELFRWLGESKDVPTVACRDELRREIAIGVEAGRPRGRCAAKHTCKISKMKCVVG